MSCAFLSIAQDPQAGTGKVNGKITDVTSGQPLEFCALAILRLPDSSVVNGGLADETGGFEIAGLKNGSYVLRIDLMGYNRNKVSFDITDEQQIVSLPDVKLGSIARQLDEVEVVAEKPDVVIELDKKVYNAEKNITATGGSAIDVLKNIPSVGVDNNGNLNLRGNSQVLIYIDGKPTAIGDANAETILGQIPASNVDNVEIITNPGSRYDAQGMAGIINIRLKKSKKETLNGNVSAGVGSRDKFNTAAAINYSKNKWGFSGSYAFRYNPLFQRMDSKRRTETNGLNQSTRSTTTNQSNTGRIGIDYNHNNNAVTSLSGQYSYSTSPYPETSYYVFLDKNHSPDTIVHRNNLSNSYIHNGEFSLNHRKPLKKKGNEFYIGSSYSVIKNRNYVDINSSQTTIADNNTTTKPLQTLNADFINHLSSVQSDLTLQITEKTKVETGVKAAYRYFQNDYSRYTSVHTSNIDTNINDRFNYYDVVAAAYGQLGHKGEKFNFQFGLRAEQAFTNAKLEKSNYDYSYQYLNFFPSLATSYKIHKDGELQLSISRRINRPRFPQLNPYLDYMDPYNVRRGNPELKPEYAYNYELAYIYNKPKSTITLTAYYRQITNAVQYFRIVDSTSGNSVLTFKNFDKNYNSGLEGIYKIQPFKFWDITNTLNLYQTSVKGTDVNGLLISRETFTWNGKIQSSMKLPYNFSFQLIGNYQAPSLNGQGKVWDIYFIDVALKKDFLKSKKLSMTANLSDIFNTREFVINTAGYGFRQDMKMKRESRILMVTLNYKFGKADAIPKKKAKSDSPGDSGGGDVY